MAIASLRDYLEISCHSLSQFEVLVLPNTTFPLKFRCRRAAEREFLACVTCHGQLRMCIMNKRKNLYSSWFSFLDLKLSNDKCMIWWNSFTLCSKVAGMQSPVVVNFIFFILCGSCLSPRRWKKVFRLSRYATSTSRFTKKFTNGSTLNLITLEERQRNNKPSEYMALKAFKTCSNLEIWALKSSECHSLLRPYIRCQL